MLDSKKSHISSKYLASICRSNPSFFAKLTISADYQKRTPHFVDAILLTIEYLQLYAQFWLMNYYMYPQASESSVQLTIVLIQSAKILLPGAFFRGTTNKGTIFGLFLFCLLFSILRTWLLFHVASAAKRGEKLRKKVATIWNWVFHFSARVIYASMVSFWVITIQLALKNSLGFDDFSRYCLITIPGIFLVFEVSISIIIERNLSYNLPTKRFMSRKESVVETITLVQKLVNQTVLTVFVRLADYLLPFAWFCNIYNFGFCLLRDFHFLKNFPLYNMKALRYEACLLVLTTCQTLAYLVQTLLRAVYDKHIDPNFGVISWMILGFLGVLFVDRTMKGMIFKIAINKCVKKWGANLMIHKAFIMKDFFKNHQLPSNQNQNPSFHYLMSQALSIQSQVILEGKDKNKQMLKKSWHKFFVGYFERLTEVFPKNHLIKLILAWFYIKKMELYGPGIRILHSLINSKDKSTVFNASLLIYELEKGTLANYKGEKRKLDLGEYTKSTSAVINLKSLMLNQAKLQIELCSGVTQDSADLYGVFKSAQNIYQAREKVERRIKKLFTIVPEYYLEPYKLCAYYNLSLNFSLEGYTEYEKLYSRMSHKYQRFLSSKELTQHTLYNKNTNLYLISGAKANMGVITYSSKGSKEFIENSIIGTHVGSLCPKGLRKFYTAAINTAIEEGNKLFLDRVHDSFYYNFPTLESSPMQFYMNIVPYFTGGLHYAFISLPTRLPFELVTFLENGEIESYTPGIARALNLTQVVRKGRILNIGDISKELGRVNEALNIVKDALGEDNIKRSLTLEEAKEIYNTFTHEGEILYLKPITSSSERNEGKSLTYRCKLIEKVAGSASLRRIMFEKTDNKGIQSEMSDDMSEKVPSEFEGMNEKEDGCINSDALSPRDQILTSMRAFIPTQSPEKKKAEEVKSISDILNSQTADDNCSSRKRPRIHPQQQSISSRTSSSSSASRLSRTLNEAIGNSHYPISHQIFIGLISVLFLSILLSQVAMKLIMDQETGNLETKKEVLRSAQRRNDYLVNINRRYRYIDGAIKGWYAPEDISSNAIDLILSYAVSNTSSLAKQNSHLIDLAKVLSVENQEKLFEKNVRVYQTDLSDPTAILTSFQVTDQIVQASLKAIGLIKDDYRKSEGELDFIFRNAVNDLLLVGEETADLFLESINSQIRVLQTKIGQTFLIALLFVSLVGIVSLTLIYREYCQEIINLSAFVKVNKKGVAIVSTKVSYFAKLIEDEVHFEDIKDMSLLNNSGMFESLGKLKVKVKEEAQIPNSKKTKRKYQLLVVKEIVLLAVLMSLISLMISLVGGYINLFSKTLNQIYFLDRMIYKFDLASSTYFDLLVENGTSYVRNQLSPVEFDEGIKTVNSIQNLIADKLKNHDGSYDPIIEGSLFDNACGYLAPVDAKFCVKNQNGAGKANLIQLISNLESILIDMRTQYEQSNKTVTSLANLILTGQIGIASSMSTITNIYQTMVARLDEKFSEQISSYENRKLQMVVIICVVTGLACLVKYFVVLGELKKNLYQFRKALRLFPPRLILSNFMLKAFLIKTTNGSFTWFKSDL